MSGYNPHPPLPLLRRPEFRAPYRSTRFSTISLALSKITEILAFRNLAQNFKNQFENPTFIFENLPGIFKALHVIVYFRNLTLIFKTLHFEYVIIFPRISRKAVCFRRPVVSPHGINALICTAAMNITEIIKSVIWGYSPDVILTADIEKCMANSMEN